MRDNYRPSRMISGGLFVCVVIGIMLVVSSCAYNGSNGSSEQSLNDRINSFYGLYKKGVPAQAFGYFLNREGAKKALTLMTLSDYKVVKIVKTGDGADAYMDLIYTVPGTGEKLIGVLVDKWVVHNGRWMIADYNGMPSGQSESGDFYVVKPYVYNSANFR